MKVVALLHLDETMPITATFVVSTTKKNNFCIGYMNKNPIEIVLDKQIK